MATKKNSVYDFVSVNFCADVDRVHNSQHVNSVFISASKDKWNDNGFRVRINFRIRLQDMHEVYAGDGYIGFLQKEEDTNYIKHLLGESELISLPANDQHRFFTMLPDMEAYRSFVRALGPRNAVKVLKCMRDMVALTEFKTQANWVDLAKSSRVFTQAFLRDYGAYFAFKNAGPVLRDLRSEDLGGMSKGFSINFQMEGRGNEHNLRFLFDHGDDLPKRIAVVIGRNGVGKSQALRQISESLLKGKKNIADVFDGQRPSVNRLLTFSPTNEAATVFPTGRGRNSIWYRRFTLNRSLKKRDGEAVSDLIVQLARSDQNIGRSSRWKILMRSLVGIDRSEELCLLRRETGDPPIPIHEMRKGDSFSALDRYGEINLRADPVRMVNGKIFPLSSGEISFLRFASQVSLYVENGSLLLLDEPETHLHPAFISQLVSLLDRLLDATGSAAIIATHSVYFVREVFSEQVTVLTVNKSGMVVPKRPNLNTFGADVGAISYFVFDEDEPSQLAKRVKEKLIDRFPAWEDIYTRYKRELSPDLLASLRESMIRASEDE